MQLLTLTLSWLLIAVASAQYELQSSFSGLTFFDNFQFYTSWDPTYGYVHYVDQAFAQQNGMINITNTSVSWGVDSTQILNPSANLGRLSIRLVSQQTWTHGLFILDLAHMPSNECGVWPAVWMLGSGLWPAGGEIDIIEYVNNGVNNLMALHTTPGCTVAGADEQGTLITSDCGAGAGYTGCTVSSTQPNNSGDTFNANDGGVYAWEWTSTAIRIWFFPRNAIPASILSGAPDVDAFGTPTANFAGDCDIDAYFYNASILFNVDFCGSYAGNVWQNNGCPMLDPENGWSSCNEYVALNPTAFDDTYWEANYLEVYQLPSGAATTSTSSLTSITPAISTSTGVSTALSGALGRTTSPTMTLAGTTPTSITGSFTETSSVLSVLSSLSSESEASISSASPSLVGRATSTSLLSPSSTTGLPFTPITTSSAVVTSIPTTLISTTLSTEVSIPPASSPQIITPCTGTICTSNVYVTTVQTVTVGAITPRGITASTIQGRAADRTFTPKQTEVCTFEIFPVTAQHRWTEYKCTLTIDQLLTGSLVTERLWASTTIHSGAALQLSTLLSIDNIAVETCSTQGLESITGYAFVGTFTPSSTYIHSTTLTAEPMVTAKQDKRDEVPVTLTRTATTTVSIAATQSAKKSSESSRKSSNGATVFDTPGIVLAVSLLVMIVVVV